jgi:Flp pilus assembly protein TadG
MHTTKPSLLGCFRKSTTGAIAIQFALFSTMLFGFSGGALDFMRWHTAKRVTSEALDAAVLAGARTLQMDPGNTQAALTTAASYFTQNVNSKVSYSVNTVTFVMADNNTALTATGEAKIGTMLLRVLGFNELTIANDSGSGFPKGAIVSGGQGGSNLEISLMLDMTGSMCSSGGASCTSSPKVDGLKTAASHLVDMVIATNQDTYYSKMAIVPFSSRIRIGPDGGGGGLMKVLTDLDPVWSGYYKECVSGSGSGDNENSGNWSCHQFQTQLKTAWKVMPCVTDRYFSSTGYDYTDNAPGSNRWLNAHGGDRMIKSWDSSNAVPATQRGLTDADPADNWNYNSDGSCADVAGSNQIMPLSTDKDALKARINALTAYGSTSGALGTAWTWYMLSPNWGSVWTGAARPGTYADVTTVQNNGRPLLRKVAVLMTDGVYNTVRGWKDQDQQTASNHAKQLCTNMKAQGIEIFTVGLALDELSTTARGIAENTLQSCGTDLSHFYSTLNVEELQTAFQDIAFQLSAVRLTR